MNININYNELDNLSKNDFYNYLKIKLNELSIKDFFNMFSCDYLIDAFDNRNICIGILYDYICTLDINSFLEYLFCNDYLFKCVTDDYFISNDYYNSNQVINYDNLLKGIKKCEELELYNNISWFFRRKYDEGTKRYLLKYEDLSENIITEIIGELSVEEKNEVFQDENLSLGLYDYFNFMGCLNCKINKSILKQKDFISKLFTGSLIELRIHLGFLSRKNDPVFLDNLLYEYYDKLINSYNSKYDMFNDYYKLLCGSKEDIDPYLYCDVKDRCDEKYLKVITNLKLSELIIECLFKTNYYYFMIDLNEIIKYNMKCKKIGNDRIKFYELFHNIDRLSSLEKIELYKKYKNMNLNDLFYCDMRKMKDIAYTNINRDLFTVNNLLYINLELSNKYGVPVYDLRDRPYYILIRNIINNYRQETKYNRSCYTLISNTNTTTIRDIGYLYGYNSFDINKVVHMNDNDSYSGEYENGVTINLCVNKLLTSMELVSGCYSEIQLLNELKGLTYYEQKPDFLVSKDKIDNSYIRESKRLNIPIVLIKSRNKMIHNNYLDSQYPNIYDELSLKQKRLDKYNLY